MNPVRHTRDIASQEHDTFGDLDIEIEVTALKDR